MLQFRDEAKDSQRFQIGDRTLDRIIQRAAMLALATFSRSDRERLIRHAAKAMQAGDLAGAAGERARGIVAGYVVVGLEGRLAVAEEVVSV